jgi:hypothetical protein
MFNGYAQYGGTEIVNVARTRAYIEKNDATFPFNSCEKSDGLREALGDDVYESPIQDDAPWYDPQNPASARFYGLYPLSMEGFEDDTRTATVNENIGDGAFVSGVRRGSRSLRIHGVLLGSDDDAVSAGLAWLKGAVSSSGCDDGDCGGASMCWYNARPNIVDCFDPSAGTASGSQTTGVTNATAPTNFPAPPLDGKFSVSWDIPQTDGVVFRYGMTTKEGVPISRFGPYVSARTNVLVNPTFRDNADGWTPVGGSLLAYGPDGVDGQKLIVSNPAKPQVISHNYVPQSSAEVPPTDWVTNGIGGLAVVPAVDAPIGTNVVRVQQDINLSSLYLNVPIVGPTVPVSGMVSFYLHDTADTLGIVVLDTTNAIVSNLTIAGGSLAPGYTRITLPSPIAAGYTIQINTNGERATEPLMVDAFMATPGPLVDYFDGDTPNDPDSKFFYAWVSNDERNGSTMTYYPASSPKFGIKSPTPLSTGFGPVTVSAAVRSISAANLTVTVYTPAGAVMATQNFPQVGLDWQRIYVTAPNGSAFYFTVTGDSVFSVDQFMAEKSEAWLPYFDVDLHTLPFELSNASDYTFSTTVDGLARMVWNGYADPDAVANSIVFPEVCGNDWVAELDVDYGFFNSSTVKWSVIGRVSGPDQAARWERSFHDVVPVSGPSVISDIITSSGGVAKEVEIIFTSGPYAYSSPRELLTYEPVTTLPSIPWHDQGWITDHNNVTDPLVNTAANFAFTITGGGTANMVRDTVAPLTGLPSEFPVTGAHAARVNISGASTSVEIRNVRTILPVTPGEVRSFSVYALVNAVVGGATQSTVVQFLNSGGAQVGSTSTVAQATALSNSSWTRYVHQNITVPANATGAVVTFRETGTIPVGHILWVTAWMSNIGTTVGNTTAGSFVDPSGNASFAWDGAANASGSGRYASFQCLANPSADPIIDPAVPLPPSKPVAPRVTNPVITTPTSWKRYYLGIEAQEVSAWNQTVPTITLTSGLTLVRAIRVRFYPNPFDYDVTDIDPCSYCSEFILSYLPANTELTIDGTVQRASASVKGASPQPASNLLYGTDGNPMTWPSLSCGVGYAVTIDTPINAPSDLTVSLAMTRQE